MYSEVSIREHPERKYNLFEFWWSVDYLTEVYVVVLS